MDNKKDHIAFKERESYVHRDGRRVERYVGNLGLFGSLYRTREASRYFVPLVLTLLHFIVYKQLSLKLTILLHDDTRLLGTVWRKGQKVKKGTEKEQGRVLGMMSLVKAILVHLPPTPNKVERHSFYSLEMTFRTVGLLTLGRQRSGTCRQGAKADKAQSGGSCSIIRNQPMRAGGSLMLP